MIVSLSMPGYSEYSGLRFVIGFDNVTGESSSFVKLALLEGPESAVLSRLASRLSGSSIGVCHLCLLLPSS